MGDVVQFGRPAAPAQPEPAPAPVNVNTSGDDGPHMQGAVRCNGCGHEWQAVAPAGSNENRGPFGELECPQCHALKGVWIHHCIYDHEGLVHWSCAHCKGFLFSVARQPDSDMPALCCANCGSVADLIDAFPR